MYANSGGSSESTSDPDPTRSGAPARGFEASVAGGAAEALRTALPRSRRASTGASARPRAPAPRTKRRPSSPHRPGGAPSPHAWRLATAYDFRPTAQIQRRVNRSTARARTTGAAAMKAERLSYRFGATRAPWAARPTASWGRWLRSVEHCCSGSSCWIASAAPQASRSRCCCSRSRSRSPRLRSPDAPSRSGHQSPVRSASAGCVGRRRFRSIGLPAAYRTIKRSASRWSSPVRCAASSSSRSIHQGRAPRSTLGASREVAYAGTRLSGAVLRRCSTPRSRSVGSRSKAPCSPPAANAPIRRLQWIERTALRAGRRARALAAHRA